MSLPGVRRSWVNWTIRTLLATIVLGIGGIGSIWSLAQVVAKSDAITAYRLAPYDGRIAALAAASLSEDGASASDRRRSDALARVALYHDPITVTAVSTLAINAWVRGDTIVARRLFEIAQKLSRRDVRTQLWGIEDAVTRGDISGALRHYDIALRVRSSMAELLFPVMASAVADPAIRKAVINKIAEKPLWGENFLLYITAHPPDPKSVGALMMGLRHVGVTVPESAYAQAVNGLIAAGLADDAWALYTSVHTTASRIHLRDPRFTVTTQTPTWLDWVPVDDNSGITTAIYDGMADFHAPTSVGGPLLRQMQLLPPGKYRFSGHSRGINQSPDARPYWTLTCRNQAELGRLSVTNSTQRGGRFAGTFSVPMGCPIQVLVLVASPSDKIEGLSGQIDFVHLEPIQ